MDRGATRTIVVIPAYNEQDALPGVLAELARVVPDHDVVVVDDGSVDDTAAIASGSGAVCVRLPFNLGIGGALRAGYRYALEHGYDRAVQFDGDGQHRADQIARLEAELDAGAHLAVGNRFGEQHYEVSLGRRSAMALLRIGVRLLTGRRFGDTSSGFRAVRRPLLDVFATDYPVEYMDSVETLVSACRAGFDVREVPVLMSPRAGGVPSTRNVRLVYHYARLFVVLLGSPRRPTPIAEPPSS